jgi:hypothetical protein
MSPGDVAVAIPVAAAAWASNAQTLKAGIACAMPCHPQITVGVLSVAMTSIDVGAQNVWPAFAFLSTHGEN